ncbi:glycosyltransferase family 2 protein [Chryseobacterium taklimakanense]|uniref:Glycosyltransferase n=1 Tax=Chryseobacterium taklimakanense TaxID=536441 RepID=A0A3G8WDY3_9FLAO|nr:glycosyltransferase [Chryseobacterium taklimakanense]AZI19340.1 glycosyltransferase [Chryseobacterium taklimakanense]
MKLSVCIPVYNFDVRELVRDLQKEITEHQINAEILLIDDASDQHYIRINKGIENEVENFVFLEKNAGRSQIRNLFLYYASGDYLLFLDCDGKVANPHFLKNYLSYIEKIMLKRFMEAEKFQNFNLTVTICCDGDMQMSGKIFL